MKFKCIPEWTKILLLEKRLVDETERGQIAMTTLGMYFCMKHLFKLSSFFTLYEMTCIIIIFGSKIHIRQNRK